MKIQSNDNKIITIPLSMTGHNRKMLFERKEAYRVHVNLQRLSWEDYFFMLSEEVNNKLRSKNDRRQRIEFEDSGE